MSSELFRTLAVDFSLEWILCVILLAFAILKPEDERV